MSRDNRETNLAILERLGTLAARQEAHKSLDWNPVKFQFVTGNENGPPAKGFKATLASPDTSMPQLEEVSNDEGLIDFGLVRYGGYTLSLVAPWGETTTFGSLGVTVRPGQVHSQTIVCPPQPVLADVKFEIEWPEDLRAAKLAAYCQFAVQIRTVGNLHWSDSKQRTCFVTGDGRLLVTDSPYLYLGGGYMGGGRLGGQTRLAFERKESIQFDSHRECSLSNLFIVRSPHIAKEGELVLSSEPFGGYTFLGVDAWNNNPQAAGLQFSQNYPRHKFFPAGHDLPNEVLPAPVLTAKAGELNHWKIKLPDLLVEYVREQLAHSKGSDEPQTGEVK
jgi:hypothetical protein